MLRSKELSTEFPDTLVGCHTNNVRSLILTAYQQSTLASLKGFPVLRKRLESASEYSTRFFIPADRVISPQRDLT